VNLLALVLFWVATAFAGSTITITVGAVPAQAGVNQTTNRIYVANLNSNNVSVIDGGSNTVVSTVVVGNSPSDIGINSTTNMIYVPNSSGNTVSVIDGNTDTVVATVPGMSSPLRLAVDSVTNQIFVSNFNTNNVAVIDGATNTVIATVQVGSGPTGVRVNSTANLIYVANLSSGTISVIDGNSNTVTDTFTLPQGASPGNIGWDPITNRLFVTDGFNKVVYVVDASTGSLLKTITGGKVPFKSPTNVAMFQPGKSVLISDLSLNAVVQVNESTYAVSAGLKGGNGPAGIAVNRKTGNIYVTETGNGTVNVYTQPK
jgi:YVTN family beta-propeller protein